MAKRRVPAPLGISKLSAAPRGVRGFQAEPAWESNVLSPVLGTQLSYHGSLLLIRGPRASPNPYGQCRRDANPSREGCSFLQCSHRAPELCLEARMWEVQNTPQPTLQGSLWGQLCPGGSSSSPRSPAPSSLTHKQGDTKDIIIHVALPMHSSHLPPIPFLHPMRYPCCKRPL